MSKTILFAGATGVTTLPTRFLPAAGGIPESLITAVEANAAPAVMRTMP